MPYPSRLTGMNAARSRFGDQADRVAVFFSEGDAMADAAVLALRDLPTGQDMLVRALEHGIDSLGDETPPALMQLFRQLEHVPCWVDHARCERGGRVFLRCGLFGGVALGFGALARAYCSSGGNKPLAMTRALIDNAPARLNNTGRFVCAVSARGGLMRGAPGYRQAVHVRLMHARVRLALLGQTSWRSQAWGVPINQTDVALTALLFSHGFSGFVRKLGVRVTHEEEGDLLHLWRYAGYLMGVREELLCATVTEAERLSDLVDVMDSGPDDDSRQLLMPLLHAEPPEARARSPRFNQAARRVLTAACRDMIGDAFADELGLAYGPSDLAFRYLLRPTVAVVGRVHRQIPGAEQRALRFGERYWAAVSGERPTAPRSDQRSGRFVRSRVATA